MRSSASVSQAVALTVILIIAGPANGAEPPDRRYVPIEVARRLAYEAEIQQFHDQDAVMYFNPDQMKGDGDPDFYFFSAEFSSPIGDQGLGFYGVNRWTGDVWSVLGVVCTRIVSPTLVKHQAEIKKQSGGKEPGFSGVLRAKRPGYCEGS